MGGESIGARVGGGRGGGGGRVYADMLYFDYLCNYNVIVGLV
jgi:hypothetical protein